VGKRVGGIHGKKVPPVKIPPQTDIDLGSILMQAKSQNAGSALLKPVP
jgi:hypothetical protein